MLVSPFSILLGICLTFLGVNVSAKDQAAKSAVAEALSKIKKYPAYRLTCSLEAYLAPQGSGAMVPVKISETAVLLVARKNGVVRAHESCKKELTIFPRPIPDKTEATTLWDGRWIYSWGSEFNFATKMADLDVNRDARLIESLYAALLKEDNLSLRGEEMVEGQQCSVLETSSKFFAFPIDEDGKATILLNKSTGFPVRITAKKQMSKGVVNYTTVETNPTYSSEMFVPPKNVVFNRVKGAEGMENELTHPK